MPWKECDAVSERMKFVSRLLSGERMTDLCKEYGIARKTGYKIHERFKLEGLNGLNDKSRAARGRPNQTPKLVQRKILELREEHSTWGAPKIKAWLEKHNPSLKIPAPSTIHVILQRNDLITKKRRQTSNYKSVGTSFEPVTQPNDLWCTDFKGQFRMTNKKYCYPLTLTDQHSRFLIECDAMEQINESDCIAAFERIFEEYGLPSAIRSDNGVPFASRSYFGLSRLSVYWIRQGIRLERITPGHPEQNGAHERMHRTLKETIKPAENIIKQQEDLDHFRDVFNNQRPHQALEMKTPFDLYRKSERKSKLILDPLEYPTHEHTHQVSKCGSLWFSDRKRLFVGTPFAGENLGVSQIDNGLWKVNFASYELGVFDRELMKLQVSENPFLQKP